MVYHFKVILKIPKKEEIEAVQKILLKYNEHIQSEIHGQALKYITESSEDEIIIEHRNKETLNGLQKEISSFIESIFSEYHLKLLKFSLRQNEWEAFCTDVSEVQNCDEIPSLQNYLQSFKEEKKDQEKRFLEQVAKKYGQKLEKYYDKFKDEEVEIRNNLEKMLQDVNSTLESP